MTHTQGSASAGASRAGTAGSALQLVIFDCDGVLVDSEPISHAVLLRLLAAEGLSMTMAEGRREYQGLLMADVVERAEGSLGRPLRDGWLARFERERAAAFRAELKPIPGAADAVARIRAAGIPVCVASQGRLAKTRTSLALTGLDSLFAQDARFSADSVPRGKPAPDLFLYAAAAMGAGPEGCAVVEDTPSGVRAAVSAGMRAFGYAADSDAQALLEAGAELLDSLAELPLRLGLG